MSKAAKKPDAFAKTAGKLKSHWPGLIVLAAALVFRVTYILSFRGSAMFEPILPGYDMTVFHNWAMRIAQGQLTYDSAFYQAPLYPYLLGAVYALAGPSVLAATLLQAVLGTLSVGLVYILACKLFSRSTALWAAALMAFTPIFPFYEGFFLRATLVTFLNLLILAALISFNPKRAFAWAAGCGVLLGIDALARSNTLIILPLGMFWIWRQLEGHPRARRAGAVSVFFIMTFLAVSPATLHNILVGHQWALVSTNMQENWRIGNSYDSTGGFCYPKEGEVPILSPDLVRLWWKKFLKLASDYEEPNNLNFYHFRRYYSVLRLPVLSWGFFLAFALAGVVLSWPRRRQLFPLYGYFVLYGATLVAFFVLSRLRVPLWPVLIILTGHTFSRVFEDLRRKKVLVPALALILPSTLALVLVRSAPKVIQPQYFDNMVLVYEKLGDARGIIEELNDKLGLYPNDPAALWKLAYYLQNEGKKEAALENLEKLLALYPEEPQVLRAAGLLELELGRRNRAEEHLRRYLELYPQAPDSLRIREIISGFNAP
ncbi:MAG TPA: tetratricopeptide repeat protein [archaeon]|nr:tetratricopeptide repeat protein [archaeon]